jgi:ATP-dependent DNA helicase RecG
MAVSNPRALLDRLLREPAESEWLEFKHNQSNVEEIGEYISALANAAMLAGKSRAFLMFSDRRWQPCESRNHGQA